MKNRFMPFRRRSAWGDRGRLARVALAVACIGVLLSGASPGALAQQAPAPGAVPAARKATNVAVITIKGEIKGKESGDTTAISVERRLKLAERAGADAVVIELDTPGGELFAALTICGLIKSCPIQNTVAWVNTKAYSAGAVIALSCREIVTSPASDFGDALPIQYHLVTGQVIPMPAAERQKKLAPLIGEVVDSARRNGWDEYLVQGFVALGVELWLVENIQSGQRLFVDRAEYRAIFGEEPAPGRPHMPSAKSEGPSGAGLQEASDAAPGSQADSKPRGTSPLVDADKHVKPASPDLAGVAREADARQTAASARPMITKADRGQWRLVEYVSDGSGPLIFKADDLIRYGLASQKIKNDEELKAFFGATNLQRLDETWSEGLVTFLTNMIVRAVLIVIFLIALFIEMTHPGVILPGAVAVVALFALLAPPFIIGMAGWWEVAAIIGGLMLILLEIFVIPGFGVAGIAGILALFAGLVGTFVPQGAGGIFPNTPAAKDDLLYGFTTVFAAAATSMIGMYFLGKHFGSLPLLGRLVLKNPDSSDVDDVGMLAAMDPGPGELRVGMTGAAITPLRPSGRVQFGERIVDVVSDLGWIPAGAQVRIVEAGEFRVAVELVPPGGTGAGAGSTEPSGTGEGGERA